MTIIDPPDIKIYTEIEQGKKWLNQYRGCLPIFTCTLGFTATALLEGISTAGSTSESRRYTALADGEFLVNGIQKNPTFPLPPLTVGISPTFISRAVVEKFNLPLYLFNAGLLQKPSVKNIDLQGKPANCVSSGKALPLEVVKHLYQQGLCWGEILAKEAKSSYLILSECVVGGTTTALAVLTALGIDSRGKVNSSHPICNHQQKWDLVQEGLKKAGLNNENNLINPLQIIAAVGDPMQIVVAGIALSASKKIGVMLAGGTQMLAIFALIKALKNTSYHHAKLENIIIGTTRWVAEDLTGDTIGLSHLIGNVSLCATDLNFSTSSYSNLQAYEKGYVKEGVGAGGSAIASHLLGITKEELLHMVEAIVSSFVMVTKS
ncbi:MAG: TIGR00303 family protein [Cyanobacteria bacterium]|nr:TIGR00303 family protein [Cyanobacteria bacterium CG_2015-16_32_12]NCO78789.1 TIGR00303 family protein [Cyanobacteria bacterium CG_2015-22_32_23]NCQ04701.1 TIGR00303 family protein [Cyanobacteria bacterium CG_2015-09_32_10]NCQ42103.1 TIGR00303 family protein [Cyanobacteria bacterium CG_2015-04_32_10]NCS86096.1 TIGR00303 family protein [Cyanobacteria bacterium CG_2015-02_32_10]